MSTLVETELTYHANSWDYFLTNKECPVEQRCLTSNYHGTKCPYVKSINRDYLVECILPNTVKFMGEEC